MTARPVKERQIRMVQRRVVLSGCSGGGKSTLLSALKARGHTVFDEPGRRVVQGAALGDGRVLPETDPALFAERCIDLAIADHRAAPEGVSFFDRSVVDAVAALQRLGLPVRGRFGPVLDRYRYGRDVFLTPPWPKIHETDDERTHSFDAARVEYDDLALVYPRLGHRVHILPKSGVDERVRFVEAVLGLESGHGNG
jgi:predicted ATPase